MRIAHLNSPQLKPKNKLLRRTSRALRSHPARYTNLSFDQPDKYRYAILTTKWLPARSGPVRQDTPPTIYHRPSMDNITLARLLDETAALLEIDAADPFRIRSYRRAAEAVEQQTTQLSTLARP